MHHPSLHNLLLLLLPFLLSTATTHSNPSHAPYTPTDFILLNCGASSDETSLDGRRWNGDTNSKFLTSNSKPASSSFTASKQDPSVSLVPFTTARIIYSHFTYTFPALPGPKFIRFYFYPVTYSNLDTSNSFFSLVANNYRLLHNFSASLAASASKPRVATFFREFIITVPDDQILNLTFSPSPNSFAFINGIEVISIPNNLYAHSNDIPIPFVGFDYPFSFDNGTALQTVQRLNVGGLDINGVDDTGMYRTWNRDGDFMLGAQVGITPTNPSDNLTIKYTKKTPPYTAPESVYSTFRSMGTDPTANLKYNLTWLFPVDGGFNYLVRLHFCEFRTEVRKSNQVVFNIFINHQLAEAGVDVFYLSGGSGVPLYKDYTMWVPEGRIHGSQDLRLELHPDLALQPKYHDAFLNGVEIFKLNKTDGNLAGPNPEVIKAPTPETGQNPPIKSRARSRGLLHFIVVLGLVIGSVCALSFVLCIFILQQKRTAKGSTNNEPNSPSIPLSSCSRPITIKTSSQTFNSCRQFTLFEIEIATCKFDDDFVIGSGGFGNVYKGHIDDGATLVAIKRLHSSSRQGTHEFRTEIQLLSKLRHSNLVSLIGYCDDAGEMILVYEYMHRGTLRDHLYSTKNPPIPWKRRLEICIGAARGLEHLHKGVKDMIIHRDVKSTNILIDDNWVAKVSDFGLSRMGPTTMSQTHVSTVVRGSVGYVDPEYYRRQQLTEKSDVYSFGVVLFEILCARPSVIPNLPKEQTSLAEWARTCYQYGNLHRVIDKHLIGKISPQCLEQFGEIAASCVREQGRQRPTMSDVVRGLEVALWIEDSGEGNNGNGNGVSMEQESPLMLGRGEGMTSDCDEICSG